MRLPHYVLIGAMLLPACKGCNKNDNNDDPPPMPTPPTAVSAEPPAPTVLTTAEPAKAGEFVRPELDNRSDGVTGTALTVPGAKALLNVASDWKVTKGTEQVATAPDGRSRLAAGAGTDPTAMLDSLATANGLSACQWGGPLSLTVGKDNLSTQAADGTCQKGGAKANAAWMATEGLVVVGSWDEGADQSGMFGAMRSVAKVKTGVSTTRLVQCCRALAQNSKSAPPMQAPFMMQAAATCEAAARNNNSGAVNAALQQFGMSCK